MKTVKFNFGGKSWEVQANNSGWIAPGAPADLVKALKEAPRAGVTSKGVPIVKSDDGTNIYLGAAELRNDGESIHQTSGSGTGTNSKVTVPYAIAKEVMGLKGLSAECKEFFAGIVQEEEQAKTKKLDQLKSLMSGFSAEELKALLSE